MSSSPICILLIYLANSQALHQKYGQMQLIDCIEHTGQGSLVAQLAFHCRDRRDRLHCGRADGHAFQTIRPGWVDAALHTNLVGGGAIEGDWIPGWYIHYVQMIADRLT